MTRVAKQRGVHNSTRLKLEKAALVRLVSNGDLCCLQFLSQKCSLRYSGCVVI
jgi:hypothetical protein